MEGVKHIKPSVSILVILFLCASILSTPLYSFSLSVHSSVVAKKSKTTSKSDTELPYEEKEKEVENRAEDKSQNHFFFICLVRASLSFPNTGARQDCSINTPCFYGNATGIPLYLAKRVLLI